MSIKQLFDIPYCFPDIGFQNSWELSVSYLPHSFLEYCQLQHTTYTALGTGHPAHWQKYSTVILFMTSRDSHALFFRSTWMKKSKRLIIQSCSNKSLGWSLETHSSYCFSADCHCPRKLPPPPQPPPAVIYTLYCLVYVMVSSTAYVFLSCRGLQHSQLNPWLVPIHWGTSLKEEPLCQK